METVLDSGGIPWDLTTRLGRGGSSEVFLATPCHLTAVMNGNGLITDVAVACKVVKKKWSKKNHEADIHRSTSHPNIVQFIDSVDTEDHVIIFLELCVHKDLALLQKKRPMVESHVRFIVRQLTSALCYLHAADIVHRDLKLQNVFIAHDVKKGLTVKLGDFGLAVKLEYPDQRRHTICGSPNYIAPECLNDGFGCDEEECGYSFSVDVWAMGVILYALLIGIPPFETSEQDPKATYRCIRKCRFSYPAHRVKPCTEAVELIQSILQLDPSLRPTMDQLWQHSFLTMGDSPGKNGYALKRRMVGTNIGFARDCGRVFIRK